MGETDSHPFDDYKYVASAVSARVLSVICAWPPYSSRQINSDVEKKEQESACACELCE
jgi:hypothetical protein